MATAFMGTACFMLAAEVWRAIAGYGGTYEISDGFRIRRIAGGKGARIGRILKQCPDSKGYPQVTLYLRGKRKNLYVAHLVADAFLPPKNPTDQVLRHLNDDPTDNRPENLAWGTHSDNLRDAYRNGRIDSAVRGIAHGMAKLTEDDVREIRRLYATGEFTQRELALRFGVSQMAIWEIVLRKTWKHVV